jgi:hypothetical protein
MTENFAIVLNLESDSTEQDRQRYRDRVAAGGCCNARCGNEGRHEFAIWWKCPRGHREELLYCAIHGPRHLKIAMRPGTRRECQACGGWLVDGAWMSPLIEGLPV